MSERGALKQFRFYPCLEDRFLNAGVASGSYFHQDILVARQIFEHSPQRHIDIGSRIDGFVAHVAVFRVIDVFDIRRLSTTTRNINFHQFDCMAPLSSELISCTDSLSCLHALEHFGLGRYGDPVDPAGPEKGLTNMIRMLKKDGRFYLSVPIGPERIEFNAHRVFNPLQLLHSVEKELALEAFSFIDDNGDLHEDVELNKDRLQNAFGCNFGMGIFQFRKV